MAVDGPPAATPKTMPLPLMSLSLPLSLPLSLSLPLVVPLMSPVPLMLVLMLLPLLQLMLLLLLLLPCSLLPSPLTREWRRSSSGEGGGGGGGDGDGDDDDDDNDEKTPRLPGDDPAPPPGEVGGGVVDDNNDMLPGDAHSFSVAVAWSSFPSMRLLHPPCPVNSASIRLRQFSSCSLAAFSRAASMYAHLRCSTLACLRRRAELSCVELS